MRLAAERSISILLAAAMLLLLAACGAAASAGKAESGKAEAGAAASTADPVEDETLKGKKGNEMKVYEATNYVDVNGVRLHYARAGKGKPIVLVHGNAEDHHLFDTEIDQLVKAGYEVYAPDSRGHGANKPMSEYHYEDMAEDIYQFIRAMGLEKPALYGHSDGGILALLLETRHPGTLGRLAISGTNLSPEGIVPGFIEEYTELNKKEPDPLVTLMLTEPHIDPKSLQTITIPVLVTVGENDLILRSETDKIMANLPDAELVVVKGADHGSYIVDSEIMGNLLIDFLSRHE